MIEGYHWLLWGHGALRIGTGPMEAARCDSCGRMRKDIAWFGDEDAGTERPLCFGCAKLKWEAGQGQPAPVQLRPFDGG